MYISRITNDNRKQTTVVHLVEVAELASKWAEIMGFTQTARIISLLHDMGKYSQAFLAYLYEQNKRKRGSIVHSTQGAKYIFEIAIESDKRATFIAEMIGLCIAGHHGVLMDGLSPDGDMPFLKRISAQDTNDLHFEEVKTKFTKNCCQSNDLKAMLEEAYCELQHFIEICHSQTLNIAFMIHMLTKYLFSCLVDADRYNAYCFEIGAKSESNLIQPPWNDYLNILESYLVQKSVHSNKPIDQIRHQISEKCYRGANRLQGIYQLEVPTGGGKTLSSLRFALEHARIHGMERIIYIIPYLSILEQTADTIREALGFTTDDMRVLEHHSNLVLPEDEESVQEIKLLTDRWDAPIVITTAVQFLESVFSEKASKLRKLHNMANAVLIFDEIQSLPVKCVNLFNDAVNFISIFGKSTVLLCSATQPLLNCVEHSIRLAGSNLVQNMENDFTSLNRTHIIPITKKYTCESLADFVLEKQQDNGNCLVILNTKKNVLELFSIVKARVTERGLPVTLYHLSTLMCPAHRIEKLNEMKEKIKLHEPIICISSQLIEAGVDISFGCVVRACAGLDSIAQAAGRCNRHGEDPKGRDVYIINLTDENLSRLPDIKIGTGITERIIEEKYEDLLCKKALDRYYNEYFYKRAGEMNYSIGQNCDLYDLLSVNQKGKDAYKNRTHHGERTPQYLQALQTAGENFCVIENNSTSVLIPYNQGAALAEKYQKANLYEKTAILRKMARYTVSLYQYQIDKLNEAGALMNLDVDLLLLDKDFYDIERGVNLEKDMKFLYY